MEQVYTPTVIADTPFPQTDQLQTNPTQQTSNQTYGQQTIQASSFPEPVIAQELLSTALNTRSKKIIQEFQFAQSGALQIGDYTQGVNGDIRISPEGITARDLAGNTTFDLDGDTGDAVFAGTIRAGDVTVVDGGGLVSLANFSMDIETSITSQSTTSTSFIDITDPQLTFTVPREVHMLFFASVTLNTNGSAGQGEAILTLEDNISLGGTVVVNGGTSSNTATGSIIAIKASVGAGSHTLKIRLRTSNGATTAKLTGDSKSVGYIILGR